MEKFILNKECEIEESFFYAYSPHARSVKKFELRDSCIANYIEGKADEFSYTSIITRKKYGAGTRVSTKCTFGKFGAPLIVFAEDTEEGRNGMRIYGLHFEVVAYERGFNVWHIVPAYDNAVRPIKSTRIGTMEFDILPDEMIDISVSFGKKKIVLTVNGRSAEIENEDFPETFHTGITACEGPNRFYEFCIEE